MMLQYYIDEKVEFKEAFEKKLGMSEAEIVASKLLRHFKLPKIRVDWTSGRNHPHAGGWTLTLNSDWNNFGVLCHEVAHVYQYNNPKMHAYYSKLGFHRFHDKKHQKIMNRMINYCKKKDWFVNELQRRTVVKFKPLPTEIELMQKELIKTQEKIVKYEKKIMFYQKKLAKAKRSYKMRLLWQEKKTKGATK